MGGAERFTREGADSPPRPRKRMSVPRASLPKAAVRAVAAFRRHQMVDTAAALTYYGMLSLFPLMVVAVSLFALIGDPTTVTEFVSYLARSGADQQTRDAVEATMSNIVMTTGGTAGAALGVSTLVALNGASGAFGAAGRALNRVHGIDEDRGFVRRKLTDIATTLVLVLLFLVVAVSLFLGGGVAEDLFAEIGLGDTAAAIWAVARWPVALAAAIVAYGIVYAVAPDVQPRRYRWLTAGAVSGVAIWILASLAFGLYIQNFSSYGAAYGAAGAVIVLLLWLWVSACAFLLGAELNAEIERAETAGRGGPPFVTPPPDPDREAPAGVQPRPARDPAVHRERAG